MKCRNGYIFTKEENENWNENWSKKNMKFNSVAEIQLWNFEEIDGGTPIPNEPGPEYTIPTHITPQNPTGADILNLSAHNERNPRVIVVGSNKDNVAIIRKDGDVYLLIDNPQEERDASLSE